VTSTDFLFSLRLLGPENRFGMSFLRDGDGLSGAIRAVARAQDDAERLWSPHGTYRRHFRGLGHHWLAAPQAWPDPWLSVAHAAAVMPEATFNSGFIQLPLYSPVDVAERVATLDHLTDGKFTLTCGLGWREPEFRAAGTEVSQRVSRFEESLEICNRLWAGETLDHRGQHWTVEGQLGLLPVQQPHPTIVLGAQSVAAARRAARLGDAIDVPGTMSHESYGRVISAYLEQVDRLERARPESLLIRKFICVDEDDFAARERAKRTGRAYNWYAGATTWVGSDIEVAISEDDETQKRTIAGTPENVVGELIPLIEEFSFNQVLLTAVAPVDGPNAMQEHFQFILERVIRPVFDHFGTPKEQRILRG
jgi:alkanesulfonate monooxygenase SsuD/methylene tetrahydromethanopterin reductase-like flavin-dependent oxidoreductase (luciferase family)